jgi:hypothetical protein
VGARSLVVAPGPAGGDGRDPRRRRPVERPEPTIEGPVGGTPSLASTNFDLASIGYEQAPNFLAGTATAYTSATPLSSDGRWTVRPGTTPSKARMVVCRPIDPEKFNGTVVVEWNNVSAGDQTPVVGPPVMRVLVGVRCATGRRTRRV